VASGGSALVDTTDFQIRSDLAKFTSTKLLFWIEALSLVGCDLITTEYTKMAFRLRKYFFIPLNLVCPDLALQRTPDPETRHLLYDPERLVQQFFDPINESALQLYFTALHYLPLEVPLRRMYGHEK